MKENKQTPLTRNCQKLTLPQMRHAMRMMATIEKPTGTKDDGEAYSQIFSIFPNATREELIQYGRQTEFNKKPDKTESRDSLVESEDN
jgi:hypothetical protein